MLNPGSLQFATRLEGRGLCPGGRAASSASPMAGAASWCCRTGNRRRPGLGGWQSGGPPIPPGSTVVVPQDPSPYETWGFLRDVTQVLSQVALSSAALAVIVRSSGRCGR